MRFGYETRSMSTTSVWRWLPTWLHVTNSTSALSGGVQITVVRFLSAVQTFKYSLKQRLFEISQAVHC